MDPAENIVYVVGKACLQRRCLEINGLLFRAFDSAGVGLATRCLVMDMALTTWKILLGIHFLLFRALISDVKET